MPRWAPSQNQPWRLRLFGVCTASCPKRGDAPVRDFGGPGTTWTVDESTVDVLNRCVPTIETSTSETVACVLPRCEHVPLVVEHGVAAPCLAAAMCPLPHRRDPDPLHVRSPVGVWAGPGDVPSPAGCLWPSACRFRPLWQ